MIETFLENPGFPVAVGTILVGLFTLHQYYNNRRDKFKLSNLSMDEKRTRSLYWYTENYHRARRLLIDLGHEEEVDKHLPFEMPEKALQEKE